MTANAAYPVHRVAKLSTLIGWNECRMRRDQPFIYNSQSRGVGSACHCIGFATKLRLFDSYFNGRGFDNDKTSIVYSRFVQLCRCFARSGTENGHIIRIGDTFHSKEISIQEFFTIPFIRVFYVSFANYFPSSSSSSSFVGIRFYPNLTNEPNRTLEEARIILEIP